MVELYLYATHFQLDLLSNKLIEANTKKPADFSGLFCVTAVLNVYCAYMLLSNNQGIYEVGLLSFQAGKVPNLTGKAEEVYQ